MDHRRAIGALAIVWRRWGIEPCAMIGHSAGEFSFDFLTNFFPQSAVSSRVFLSAGQAPRLRPHRVWEMQAKEAENQSRYAGPADPRPEPD